jgi:hypothetical protein
MSIIGFMLGFGPLIAGLRLVRSSALTGSLSLCSNSTECFPKAQQQPEWQSDFVTFDGSPSTWIREWIREWTSEFEVNRPLCCQFESFPAVFRGYW